MRERERAARMGSTRDARYPHPVPLPEGEGKWAQRVSLLASMGVFAPPFATLFK